MVEPFEYSLQYNKFISVRLKYGNKATWKCFLDNIFIIVGQTTHMQEMDEFFL